MTSGMRYSSLGILTELRTRASYVLKVAPEVRMCYGDVKNKTDYKVRRALSTTSSVPSKPKTRFGDHIRVNVGARGIVTIVFDEQAQQRVMLKILLNGCTVPYDQGSQITGSGYYR